MGLACVIQTPCGRRLFECCSAVIITWSLVIYADPCGPVNMAQDVTSRIKKIQNKHDYR